MLIVKWCQAALGNTVVPSFSHHILVSTVGTRFPGGLRLLPASCYWGRQQKGRERRALRASRSRGGRAASKSLREHAESLGVPYAPNVATRFCHVQLDNPGLRDFLEPSLLFLGNGVAEAVRAGMEHAETRDCGFTGRRVRLWSLGLQTRPPTAQTRRSARLAQRPAAEPGLARVLKRGQSPPRSSVRTRT